MKNMTCTNQERCGREAGYCETCVEALIADERERCARLAEDRPDIAGPALARVIRESKGD